MSSSAGQSVYNHATQDFSMLPQTIQTSSPCAQSSMHWHTSQKTGNSPTSVPCHVAVPSLTGWQRQQRWTKQPTTPQHAQHELDSSTRKSSGHSQPAQNTPSKKPTRRIWPEKVRDSISHRYRSVPPSSWVQLASAKQAGLNAWHLSQRCGCVTLTCYAHSNAASTNQSYSTTCPSSTCHEQRKFTSLIQRMKRTCMSDTDSQ